MLMNPRALLVTASRHGSAVRETLESLGVEVDRTSTCREARIAIEQRPEYDLIVSDVSLLDGNWWIVFRELARLGRRTELVFAFRPKIGTPSALALPCGASPNCSLRRMIGHPSSGCWKSSGIAGIGPFDWLRASEPFGGPTLGGLVPVPNAGCARAVQRSMGCNG